MKGSVEGARRTGIASARERSGPGNVMAVTGVVVQ